MRYRYTQIQPRKNSDVNSAILFLQELMVKYRVISIDAGNAIACGKHGLGIEQGECSTVAQGPQGRCPE